jgi:hypothetical protein
MVKALNLIGALLAIVAAVVLWRWDAPVASGGATFLVLVFAIRGFSPSRGPCVIEMAKAGKTAEEAKGVCK